MRPAVISGSPVPVRELDPPAAAGRPVAPTWRGLAPLRDLTGLGGAERASAHRRNLETSARDATAYRQYVAQWVEGALRCRTSEELRAYGPLEAAAQDYEPGATLSERARFFEEVIDRRTTDWYAGAKEVGEHILRLERRPVPLEVFFDAALTAKVEVGGRTYGGTASARGGVAPQLGGAGVTLEPGRTEVGADAGVVGAKAAFAGGRLESVEVTARAAPGVRAFTRQSRAAVEAGVAVGGKAGGKGGAPALHVEGRASVGATLLTADTVRFALSSRSFWKGEK